MELKNLPVAEPCGLTVQTFIGIGIGSGQGKVRLGGETDDQTE